MKKLLQTVGLSGQYDIDLCMIYLLQKIQAEMEIQDFPEIGKITVI